MNNIINKYISESTRKYYKKVLFIIEVPEGDYCWGGEGRICSHFDNAGGHPTCVYDIGNVKYDKEGLCPKPKECLRLKEK